MRKILVAGAALAALALAGCSTAPMDEPGKSETKSAAWEAGKEPWNDPNSPLYANKSIYFALDSYTVEPDGVQVCEIHAKFLQQHRNVRVTMEGNTDERGGREYNLALGQRRAEAVKREMMMQGAAEDQIEAVSFGKERPRALGHDEESWAENRRVDIVYR